MARRRVKKNAQKPVPSEGNDIGCYGKESQIEKKEDMLGDEDVASQLAAIKAISQMEIEQLLTGVRLLRSYFSEEQLQLPVLQYFRENLPNLSIVKSGKDGQLDLQWIDRGDNLAIMNNGDTRDVHASLLHHMTMTYPDFPVPLPMPSYSGLELSSKTVRTSLLDAESLQIGNFGLEEACNLQMFGIKDGLHTPGVNSQRMSIGTTPKTRRLPKHGEMLLSVRGSPLGVYKEDNMEAIFESGEG